MGQMSNVHKRGNMVVKERLDKKISATFKSGGVKAVHRRACSTVTYNEFLSDKLMIISLIREGVPYSLFSLIKEAAPFSESKWAEFLNVSTKTLERYKKTSKPFKPLQSEKIIEMAEVINLGEDVFGSGEKFRLWLDTPNFALGNMPPMELLKDSYGKEMVMGELTRINHGILA